MSDKSALVKGLLGDRSALAVNHLVTTPRRGKGVFMSHYIARLLAEDCEYSFIRSATLQGQRNENPSFDGWVLEMDVIHCLRKGLKEKFKKSKKDADGNKTFEQDFDLSYVCSDPVSFYHLEDIDVASSLKPNKWVFPLKFNQGGYDAVQLKQESDTVWCLRFIQITHASTHPLKLQYMQQFHDYLQDGGNIVFRLEVEVVAPMGTALSFMPPRKKQITGRLKDWDISELKIVGFARATMENE